MNFDLTAEQQRVRDAARDFARREIEPLARELDREARWPTEILARLADLGFLGVAVPAEHGGAGLDHVSYALVVEEISAACASSGVITSVNNALFCDPLLELGTDFQKREILAPTAAGKMLGCFGFTEPTGSDPRSMLTVAERQGDGSFILDGAKSFIIAGPQAEHCLVFAVTSAPTAAPPEKPGLTALLVRRGTPGYTLGPLDDKLGIKAAHSCTLFFEKVKVPRSHVLGEEGGGLDLALAALDGGRVGIAAQAIGIARAALEKAVAYARDRKVYQTPIAGLQAIQFMIADLAVEIDAARLLTLRAARMKDLGVRHTAESSMAKLLASEMATRVTHKALQIHGGHGYLTEHGVERHYRDARFTEIHEGTSEIQRIVIAGRELAQ